MTACEQTRRALQRLLSDGESAAPAVAACWDHLAACASCRADYDNALAALRVARDLAPDQSVDEELAIARARVLGAHAATSPSEFASPWQRPLAWLGSASLVAAAGALLLWITSAPSELAAPPSTRPAASQLAGRGDDGTLAGRPQLVARGDDVMFAVRSMCRAPQADGTARVYELADEPTTRGCPAGGQLVFAYLSDSRGHVAVVELGAAGARVWLPGVANTADLVLAPARTLEPLPLVIPVDTEADARTFVFLLGPHAVPIAALEQLREVQDAQRLADQHGAVLRALQIPLPAAEPAP